jgi:hypothetical protein
VVAAPLRGTAATRPDGGGVLRCAAAEVQRERWECGEVAKGLPSRGTSQWRNGTRDSGWISGAVGIPTAGDRARRRARSRWPSGAHALWWPMAEWARPV